VTETANGSSRARPIVVNGSPVLHQPCRPVERFDPELRALVDDMFASMYAANGVGLAANQIGVDLQIFVIDCPDDEKERIVGHVVNPQLVTTDDELLVESEGCLSVPGARAHVPRLLRASVVGVDVTGTPVRIDAVGLAARCLQHETDHLQGRLYIDRLSPEDREAALAEVLDPDEIDYATRVLATEGGEPA
jgi:peptide deformylase